MVAVLAFFDVAKPGLAGGVWLDSAASVALREANARAATYACSLTAKVRQ